jgi:hypothetical protein
MKLLSELRDRQEQLEQGRCCSPPLRMGLVACATVRNENAEKERRGEKTRGELRRRRGREKSSLTSSVLCRRLVSGAKMDDQL